MDRVIVIEGACDGIGKSTQFNLLRNHLVSDGYDVVSHHFPSYDTYQGEAITRYLKGEYGSINDLSCYFIHGLYALDRAVTWYSELKKEYEKGRCLLFDRYTISSLIYQAAKMDKIWEVKDFVSYVEDYEYNKLGIPRPDRVIFLTAPFDMITDMRRKRDINDGVVNDIHERDLDFMKRVYNTGMFLSNYLNWDVVSCNDDKGIKSIEDIHKDVYKLVKKK